MRELPIYWPDLKKPIDRAAHDRVTMLVQKMLDLHKQLAVPRASHEHTVIQRETEAVDREIDQVVYGLYDLTTEEIAGFDQPATTEVSSGTGDK